MNPISTIPRHLTPIAADLRWTGSGDYPAEAQSALHRRSGETARSGGRFAVLNGNQAPPEGVVFLDESPERGLAAPRKGPGSTAKQERAMQTFAKFVLCVAFWVFLLIGLLSPVMENSRYDGLTDYAAENVVSENGSFVSYADHSRDVTPAGLAR